MTVCEPVKREAHEGEDAAFGGMVEAEGAGLDEAFGEDVLEEAAQELVRCERTGRGR